MNNQIKKMSSSHDNHTAASPVRLQKFLSGAGVCSRRHGEVLITSGKVTVNGKTVTVLGTRIDPAKDRVKVDGKAVQSENRFIYIALNKPEGYVTSCRQPGDPGVLDLVDVKQRVYPIGRLDKDSTGLLLLTNDGRLHHRLSHPSFDHEKEYEVTLTRPVSDSALEKMRSGMKLKGRKTRPAVVKRLSSKRFKITLKEGRNRQIRKMVNKIGGSVKTLKRIRMGNIRIKHLAPGAWRHLTKNEREMLLTSALK